MWVHCREAESVQERTLCYFFNFIYIKMQPKKQLSVSEADAVIVTAPSALHVAWRGREQIALPFLLLALSCPPACPGCAARAAQCGQWEVSLSHLDCSVCVCAVLVPAS